MNPSEIAFGKIVLFDVDGVLIKNKAISKYVTQRSVEFVHRYHPDKSYEQICNLNRICYTKLGHSAMLKGSAKGSKSAVLDYNEYVFDNTTLQFVKDNVTETDVKHIHNVMRIVDRSCTDIGVCTNTPLVYTNQLLSCLAFDITQLDQIITSDSGMIKPHVDFFNKADKLTNTYSTVHFVDDSELNIKAVLNRPKWVAHHVTNHASIYRCVSRI